MSYPKPDAGAEGAAGDPQAAREVACRHGAPGTHRSHRERMPDGRGSYASEDSPEYTPSAVTRKIITATAAA